MKNKIYVFDADGVVIQSQQFSKIYAKEFNINIFELEHFFRSDFQKCLTGEADLKIEIKPWLIKWNWKKSVDEFLMYWFKSEHHLNEKLIETIGEFRKNKITCILATNQEKYRLDYMKKEMNFETVFDKIYSSNFIGFKKPAIEYYQYIINDLAANPGDIIYYDDSKENIETAKLLGIDANLYTPEVKIKSQVKM